MSKYVNLTNQRFGKLVVLERVANHIKPNGKQIVMWRCICDCGNLSVVSSDNLKSGHTKSCGCERIAALKERSIKHNETGTRLYDIWIGIKERCYNPNRWFGWGDRGISMCEEWTDSFEAFRDWSLSNGYSDILSIDRIDNNGNYEPSNCRWVDAKKQANNRRTNTMVEYNGEAHTISEWSDITGIKANTIAMRLRKYKWSVEKALTTIVQSAQKSY